MPGLFVAAGSTAGAGLGRGSHRPGAARRPSRRLVRVGADASSRARRSGGAGCVRAPASRTGDPARSATEGHAPHPGSPRAVVCFCEDVRGWEIQRNELPATRTRSWSSAGRAPSPDRAKASTACRPFVALSDGGAGPRAPVAESSSRPPGPRSGPFAWATWSARTVRDPGRRAAHFSARPSRPATAEVVIVGGGIGGLAIARELLARGMRDIVIVERGYPGSGATGRNVARIRAMQLTEALTHVARACQDKYDRMGDELGFNVLFYRLGYAWVLYEAEELERMRDIVAMHHRIGVRSALLSPDDTLRRLPVLRGGDPVVGAVLNNDAIVHHDAVVWAHLEHLAGRRSDSSRDDGPWHRHRRARRRSRETDRGRIETRMVVNAAGGWSGELNGLARVVAPNRPLRREVLVTAPLRRSIDAAITFYRPTRRLVQPDPARRGRHGRRRPRRAARRRPGLVGGVPAPDGVARHPQGAGPGRRAVIRQWAGMYDVSPDHLPLVGPTRQLDGWWQANGWSGRGMLLAPYLAELLATRITTGATPSRLEMFDPDRFDPAATAADSEQDYYARYATR